MRSSLSEIQISRHILAAIIGNNDKGRADLDAHSYKNTDNRKGISGHYYEYIYSVYTTERTCPKRILSESNKFVSSAPIMQTVVEFFSRAPKFVANQMTFMREIAKIHTTLESLERNKSSIKNVETYKIIARALLKIQKRTQTS